MDRDGRYGWIFGQSLEDTFSLKGDVVGFDLTGILDSEADKERMAVLSYLFRRVEREIEDRRPTIIVIDEAWKALDNAYFAERLSNWLVTARKQNTVAVMMTQYASQLERTRTGKTIVEAVPTQILLPNIRANASDYAMLNLTEKELDVLLNTGSNEPPGADPRRSGLDRRRCRSERAWTQSHHPRRHGERRGARRRRLPRPARTSGGFHDPHRLFLAALGLLASCAQYREPQANCFSFMAATDRRARQPGLHLHTARRAEGGIDV